MPFSVTWMDLEIIILSKSPRQRPILYGIVKWTYLQSSNRRTDREHNIMANQGERQEEIRRDKLGVWDWFIYTAAAAAKSLQSCPTLCDPIDGLLPGSSVPGILQAITLEWVVIPFSNAWKWKVKVKLLGRVQLLVTPWTAAYQAPLSMGFARQEYWSGEPLPSPDIYTLPCVK